MRLTLRLSNKKDYRFFYELLKQRNPSENISHRKMPTYREHCAFNDSFPYLHDFVMLDKDERVGRIYVTSKGEVGVHTVNGYYEEALELACGELKGKKFFNVAPGNKTLIDFLTRKGYRLIQQTYESP